MRAAAPLSPTGRFARAALVSVLMLPLFRCTGAESEGKTGPVSAEEHSASESAADPVPEGYVPMGHGRKPVPPPEIIATLPADGGPEYNRLVFEHSPYLLQHAGNPVDWHPWGEAAFALARERDMPVFLSVGYSTCHWCHVMEEESFEDPEVAALMNENFICIKVDREERPDVDQIYMSVTQAMTGSGGWPMTVIMTPDGVPYFTGTYFPKEGRLGRPGMKDLVPALGDAWRTKREKVLETVGQVREFLDRGPVSEPGDLPGAEALEVCFRQLRDRYDPDRGGFGTAPKFPTPHNLMILLRQWRRDGSPETLEMVENTLAWMRRGGVYDQIGFGYHRYSTDSHWLLPHFEKMLYDQALMVIANIEAHQATGKDEYARTAREVVTYVLRDMTSPEGGFYSAEDADSEGEEGVFYVWTPEKVDAVLGAEEGRLFARVFNFEPGGNFLDQATREKTGGNIPHLTRPAAEWADELGLTEAEFDARIERWRAALFDVRERRIHPFKDDKILTDWNGLMIAALARASAALGEPHYAGAARRAADFILTRLRDDRGRLLKRYRRGEAGLPAHLEDYAFMVFGLCDLYEATFEVRYLSEAIELNRRMIELFADEEGGGFWMTAADGEDLLVRPKEVYDGAIPSGNSVAAMNLLRLGRITGDPALEQRADKLLRAFSFQALRAPASHTFLMTAVDFAVGPSLEIVLAGAPESADLCAMKSALDRRFVPNKVVLFRPDDAGPDRPAPPITGIAEFTANQVSVDGKATAYVCRNHACKAPVTDVPAMLEAMGLPPG